MNCGVAGCRLRSASRATTAALPPPPPARQSGRLWRWGGASRGWGEGLTSEPAMKPGA